jgi:hypothetical protein
MRVILGFLIRSLDPRSMTAKQANHPVELVTNRQTKVVAMCLFGHIVYVAILGSGQQLSAYSV